MSEVVNNKLVFNHTKSGSKYLVKVKPLRADGVDTTFSNYIEKTAGDSTSIDVDLQVEVITTDSGVTFTVTNDLPSHINKFEWIVKTKSDAVQALNSGTLANIVTNDDIYDATTTFYDTQSSAANEVLGNSITGMKNLSTASADGGAQTVAKDYFIINDEIVRIQSINETGSPVEQSWLVTRGIGNTVAAYHDTGSSVKYMPKPSLLELPTQTTTEPQFTYAAEANATLFVWVRAINKFGIPSVWKALPLVITPETDAMVELQSQIGINLVQNWSFENETTNKADMWNNDLDAGIQTELSISYNGVGVEALQNQDAIDYNWHGSNFGSTEFIDLDGDGVYESPTIELVDGSTDSTWMDYSKVYTKSSAAIVKHPGIDSYVFKGLFGIMGFGPWADMTNNKRWEPWPIATHRPRIQVMVYQYDSTDAFITGGGGILNSDQKTLTGDYDGYTAGRSFIKPIDINFTFSGFHEDCSTFRLGFCWVVKMKQDLNALTTYVSQSLYGGDYPIGHYRMYMDTISLYAGTTAGGYTPFVLTEDTPAADIAETYMVNGEIDGGGCIVTFGENINNKPTVRLAKAEDRDLPLQCVSTNYFFTLKDEDNKEPGISTISIALKGRVRCRVHGPININDPVTIMDLGVGKKCEDSSSVVGYALQGITTSEIKEILIFIK